MEFLDRMTEQNCQLTYGGPWECRNEKDRYNP